MEAHEGLMGEIYDVFPFPAHIWETGQQSEIHASVHYSVHTDRDRELEEEEDRGRKRRRQIQKKSKKIMLGKWLENLM
jgi:hypothetical protein